MSNIDDDMKDPRRRIAACVLLALVYCTGASSAVTRDNAAPLCTIEPAPVEQFASEAISGYDIRMRIGIASQQVEDTTTRVTCWTAAEVNGTVAYYCPETFSPLRYATSVGQGDENVWESWVRFWRDDEATAWVSCDDPENPDSHENPDTIFALYKPRTVIP